MKRLVLIVSLVLAAVPAFAALGEKHVEKAGGFSLQAPQGWTFREFPGMKYQIAIGPVTNAVGPNINVVDEDFDGPVKAYVDANVAGIEKVFVEFKLLKREAFATKSGIKGERLITTSMQQNNRLRQTFYFLPGPKGRYYVVTCTAAAAGGEAFDAVFNESLRTFQLIK